MVKISKQAEQQLIELKALRRKYLDDRTDEYHRAKILVQNKLEKQRDEYEAVVVWLRTQNPPVPVSQICEAIGTTNRNTVYDILKRQAGAIEALIQQNEESHPDSPYSWFDTHAIDPETGQNFHYLNMLNMWQEYSINHYILREFYPEPTGPNGCMGEQFYTTRYDAYNHKWFLEAILPNVVMVEYAVPEAVPGYFNNLEQESNRFPGFPSPDPKEFEKALIRNPNYAKFLEWVDDNPRPLDEKEQAAKDAEEARKLANMVSTRPTGPLKRTVAPEPEEDEYNPRDYVSEEDDWMLDA